MTHDLSISALRSLSAIIAYTSTQYFTLGIEERYQPHPVHLLYPLPGTKVSDAIAESAEFRTLAPFRVRRGSESDALPIELSHPQSHSPPGTNRVNIELEYD